MKKGIVIKSFIALCFTSSVIAGGIIAGELETNLGKGMHTTSLVITNPTLSQTDIESYQNSLPDFAKPTTISEGSTQKQAYSISNLFISAYDTRAKFNSSFRDEEGNLSFSKNTCDVVLKEEYKTTNNCAFLMSLLQMNVVRKAAEGNGAVELFTTSEQGVRDWVINPDFFDDDGDDDESDNNYLYANYSSLSSLGFEKEEITAIPFFLLYNIGVLGINAVNFSISTFPTAAPIKKASLNLSNNPISVYPTSLDSNVSYLRLVLSGTNLGAQNTLPTIFGNVEELDLGDNNLQTLTAPFVQSLTSISRLSFGNSDDDTTNDNTLSSLPTEFGSVAGKLILLNLSSNSFTSNPILPFVGSLNVLENLDISNNQISVLGDLSQIADTIKTLNLSSINLSSIGTSLNSFRELTSLSMNNNSLTSLPDALATELPKLEALSIADNQLTTIPSLPTTLKTLLLNSNSDLVLNGTNLNQLINLETLNISDTKPNISTIDFSLFKLNTVIMNNIDLLEVPLTLAALPTLEVASFSDNQITEVIIAPSWKRVSYLNNPIETISSFGLESNPTLISNDNAQFSYYNVSPNLEAIVFSINSINFNKMTDPKILKLRLPFFWSQRYSEFFTAPTDVSNPNFITIPISSLNDLPEENRTSILQGLPLIISTTLEYEYITALATAALNSYNDQNSTSYKYEDLVNSELDNNFSARYKGPENFNTISDYTTSINTEVKNVADLLQNNEKFQEVNRLTANLNAENNKVAQGRLTLIVLTIIAIVMAILLTCGTLLYLTKRKKERVEEKNGQ